MANKSGKKSHKKNRNRNRNRKAGASAKAATQSRQNVADNAENVTASASDSSATKPAKPQKRSDSAASVKARKKNRRNFIKLGVLVLGGGAAAATLHAYDRKKTRIHDLSVIGNGTPAIVQMHDPSCPTCRRLKGAVEEAMGSFENVNSRIADITTRQGREFQSKYNYGKTTLLFFDAKGKHRHTLQGLQTPGSVSEAIRTHLRPGVS